MPPIIRRGAHVEPLLWDYYERFPFVALPEPPAVKRSALSIHHNFAVGVVEISDQSKIIALEKTSHGFKVDWESWVGYSAVSWEVFQTERRSEPSLFRAMIGRDDYYNFRYTDFTKYRCYQILSPEETVKLWGYVERDSDVDRQLQLALLRAPYTFAVVELKYPEENAADKTAKQVEIVSLIEEGWVIRDDDEVPGPAQVAAEKMTVPDGFHIDPIAAEPDIVQPIAFTIDERGRLWVAEGHTYPQRAPEGEGNDRILIFEDADYNGSFETRKVFMEGLNLVSGLEVGFGGVWVGAAPYFMFIADRDGDDKPDGEPRILLDGWGYQDTHETLNSFTWGPDGWLYGCHGVFTHSRVGKPGTPDEERVPLNCAYWRYHPIHHEFEIFASGTSNSWGIDFNEQGQLFSEACVIPHFWHIVQGGYYLRQSNPLGHFNKHVYTNIDTIADHRHYLGDTPHAGNGNSDSVGGGHAHCGLSIYLGDNFPEEYRGRPMLFNLHGHRINQEQLTRSGSGWIAGHGPDLMVSHDQEFMGIDMKYGPEGSVYFIDWYDKQTCHLKLPEVWDRSNGRIYRLRYGNHVPRPVDLRKNSDRELASMHQDKNEWFVRTARRVLQERSISNGNIARDAAYKLYDLLQSDPDETVRLRALWTLHSVRILDEEDLISLLRDPDEYIRAWAVQFLMEDRSPTAAPSPQVIHYLTYLAHKDPSPVVRLYVASALQRLPGEHCWNIIEGLATHSDDASDHNLPQMIWFGTEPHVLENPQRALRVAVQSQIPLLTNHIARRAGSDETARDTVLAAAMNVTEVNVRAQLLAGLSESLRGQADLSMPKTWKSAFGVLEPKADADQRKILMELAIAFGDQSAFPLLREILANTSAPEAERKRALSILSKGSDTSLPPVLHALLADSAFRLDALKALSAYDHPATPSAIFAALADCSIEEKRAAMGVLASRASYAGALLSAIESNTLSRDQMPSFIARQIKNLNDSALSQKLSEVWGKIDETPSRILEEIERYRTALAPEKLATADLQNGRLVFSQTCASCHTLFGAGNQIGPDLTGSNRADLGYILENILNPNAIIGRDYQLHIITLKDGRVLSGMIRGETDSAITLQLVDTSDVVAKSQIAESVEVPTSMMPPGLLTALNDNQTRDLIAYLASPSQIPLPGEAPYIDPKTGKVDGALEGETLKIIAKTGTAAPQAMGGFPAGNWSGDNQLWWTGNKIGDELTVAFDVEDSGKHELFAAFTQAIDYGTIQLSLNGTRIGQAVDCFNASVTTTGPLSFGTHEFATGRNQLTIKVTARNPKATGTMVGVDYLWLKAERREQGT
ncbi:MAG: HEAT repeat domain-containing protein [Verrucomicrobiae bacterium]|nr:HEAT repeat domain-containing protein [Verrucomicrobiae bacterium]